MRSRPLPAGGHDDVPRSVLVIEGDSWDGSVLRDQLLAAAGPTTEVTRVASVTEARRLLPTRGFDCVVIDIDRPATGGLEAIAIMRSALRDVPVVALSGARASQLLPVALAEGATVALEVDDLIPVRIRDALLGAVRRSTTRSVDVDDRSASLESIGCAAALVDGSGVIVAVNDAWNAVARSAGADPSRTAVGANYLVVCDLAAGPHADGAGEAAAGIRAVLAGELPQFVLDYPCNSPTEERWFSLRATPAGDLGGGALVAHVDVTDIKFAEQQIRGDQVRPHHALSRDAPILALLAADGTILELSAATRELFGVDESALHGDSGWDWIERSDLATVATTYAEVLDDPGTTRRIVVKALGVDERWHDLDLAFTNLIDDPNVRAVVVAGWDVTDARNRQIREQLGSRLLQRLPAAVIVTDDRHLVVYWNDRAAQLYGYEPHEAIGRPISELNVGPSGRAEAAVVMDALRRHGRWDGTYDAARADGSVVSVQVQLERVDDDEIDFRGTVGASIDVSERRRLEERLEFQAHHDPLTGLSNRRHFISVLEAALGDSTRDSATAVLFLDLDDFDAVNDRLGHAGGDEVIRRVGEAIVGVLRPGDTVARIGGDEFVVCCSELTDLEPARRLGERILAAVSRPVVVGGSEVLLSASIGLARAGPGVGSELLLRNADVAMYQAKQSGKGRIAAFDDHLQQRVQRRQEVANQLGAGLARGEVTPYFQPQYDLVTGELVGFEALARWNHPDRGLVGPDEFIPVAEESNLIDAIGRSVLADVCRALSTWRRRLGDRTPNVAVNVSADQLRNPGFVDHVRRTIADAGLPPRLVCLELTESSLVDPAVAGAALVSLKDVGVEIAIDDFGTGYSSFSRLHQFPVDYLKIDRSFVESMEDENGLTLVSAVLGLSKSLGFRCIAEGVETEAQLSVLREMGWDIGQGFLWSRAVPVDVATEMLLGATAGRGRHVAGAGTGVD